PITLYSTTQAVRGATAMSPSAPGTAFPRWIGWLEGETSSGAFGVDAEWSAYAMLIANGGVGGSEPLELGRADVHDERQLVVLGPPAASATTGTATAGSTTADTTTAGTTTAGTPTAGTPTAGSAAVTGARALWLGVDGTLQLTTLQAADETADETAEVGETVDLGESGRPLAVLAEHVYWHVDEFVRRTVPSATGTARTNAGEPISVAWSPVIIADAELAATGDVGDETRTTIAWYGRTQGGAVEVYASDDSRAFTPNLADRVGAVMGWSPWALWQEAAGQLLTSLLVGVVAAIALSPLLFAFSFLVASVKGVRERPALGGVALGALTPLAVASFIALRFPQSGVAQLSQRGLVVAFSALALGAVVAYLVNYRADREAQLGVLFAAFSVVLVAVSGWAFVEYDVWAPVMGLG
ncbi:MAG TPA: hypothetical protein VFD39_04945, partial [Trueperaceae bacterium]|nr:hypothetical protein [Trueperaceae bacterium]